MDGGPVLELRGVHKRFGNTRVIQGVDLQVHQGERLALIGPNGAGKSSLFNLISGRAAPSAGDILLHGNSIAGKRPFEINRLGLSRSFQVSNVFPDLSVFDNLRCSLLWSMGYGYSFLKRLSGLHDANHRTREWLARLGLEQRQGVLARHLTYAEQRALEIGMAVAAGAGVVLLDEPTAGMNAAETRHFLGLIREVTTGRTLLLVEHDMGVVFGVADRIAVLVQGEVLACGTPDAIRADPRVQEAYLGPVPRTVGA